MPLTDCSYTIEGPGLKKPKTVQYNDVQPKETVNLNESFKAKRPGDRRIVVNFNSKQIQGVSGSKKIIIVQ